MTARYDIFLLVNGSSVLSATANSTHELKLKLHQLMPDSVQGCLVVDQLTGHRSVVKREHERPTEAGQPTCVAKTPSNYRHA
jgi:hypothetical protein